MRFLIFTTLLCGSVAFAETGTLLKDSELRSKPLGDADVVTTLKAKDKVDITARQGAWASVKAEGGKSGWVRLLNVRTSSGQRGEAGVGALASVFRTGSSGNTVSTGVKGLSEEQLKNAKPNPEEAAHLNTFMESETDARNFAKQAKLSARPIGYLPAGGN